MEEEQDNKLSFFDILITRHGNELQTSLFCRRHSVVYILTSRVIYQIRTKNYDYIIQEIIIIIIIKNY